MFIIIPFPFQFIKKSIFNFKLINNTLIKLQYTLIKLQYTLI